MDKALAEQLQTAIDALYNGYNNVDGSTGLGKAGKGAMDAALAMKNARVRGAIVETWNQIGHTLRSLNDQIYDSIKQLHTAFQSYSINQIESQNETLKTSKDMMELLDEVNYDPEVGGPAFRAAPLITPTEGVDTAANIGWGVSMGVNHPDGGIGGIGFCPCRTSQAHHSPLIFIKILLCIVQSNHQVS